MTLSDVESQVLEHVDEQLLVESLVAFIRVPSVTGTDAESDLQHAHAKMLADAGLDVDSWKFDLAALQADDRFPGEETGRSEGPVISNGGRTGIRSAARFGEARYTGVERVT